MADSSGAQASEGISSPAGAQSARPDQLPDEPAWAGRRPPTGAEDGPIELLMADHRRIETLFDQYDAAPDSVRKARLCRQICAELVIHTIIEEEILYPECRRRAGRDKAAQDKLDEGQVEHDSAKLLVADLFDGGGADPLRVAKVQVLAEQIRRHIREEERPGDGVLANAQREGLDTPELARLVALRKQQLRAELETGRLRPPPPKSIKPPAPAQSRPPPPERLPQDREEGRSFLGDEDRSYRSQARGRGGWFGDPEGPFRAAGRGRDEPGHRPGGWFGDAEGRLRASREGSAERGDESRSYRSRGRTDPDDEGRGRFRDPEDGPREGWDEGPSEEHGHRSRGRGRGGWFGDPETGFRASRGGWDRR